MEQVNYNLRADLQTPATMVDGSILDESGVSTPWHFDKGDARRRDFPTKPKILVKPIVVADIKTRLYAFNEL